METKTSKSAKSAKEETKLVYIDKEANKVDVLATLEKANIMKPQTDLQKFAATTATTLKQMLKRGTNEMNVLNYIQNRAQTWVSSSDYAASRKGKDLDGAKNGVVWSIYRGKMSGKNIYPSGNVIYPSFFHKNEIEETLKCYVAKSKIYASMSPQEKKKMKIYFSVHDTRSEIIFVPYVVTWDTKNGLSCNIDENVESAPSKIARLSFGMRETNIKNVNKNCAIEVPFVEAK